MHYYQHHIGDYRRDTSHLSLLEHGVYRQLLDMYYLSEAKIPAETEVVYRRLCARTDEEKKAVDNVLSEFFKYENGWVQTRCDDEITAYKGKAARARINGKLGGRPSKTKEVISGNPEETEAKANHKPLTINQLNTLSGNPDPVPEKPKKQNRTREADEVLAHLNKVCGSRFQPVAANLNLITARLREGATVDDMKTVIDRKYAEWHDDDAMRKYLRPETLFNAIKFAGYLGAAGLLVVKQAPAIPFDREAYEAKRKADLAAAKKAYAEQEARYTVPPVGLRA